MAKELDMQQRVKCFSEAEGLPKGINWRQATENALLAAWEDDEDKREPIHKDTVYDCTWYTFDKTLQCPNAACHAALQSLRPTTPFLLNVPLHFHWVNHKMNKDVVKAYYDWMNDPTTGLWRSCMQDAVILVDDDDFPVATLWTNLKDVPIYPLVHYCLSTRFLTEHVERFKHLEKRFEETQDIHLAFLLSIFFVSDGRYRDCIWHSSYQTHQYTLPKRWVVPHDFTETMGNNYNATIRVNKLFSEKGKEFNGKMQGLIETYKEMKKC
jgi:hypothetical protein